MAKPRLTDEQIAALPKEKRERTLKRRRDRERAKIKQGLSGSQPAKNIRKVDFSLPSNPEPAAPGEVINGLDPKDHRARAIYADFRRRLQAAGRWAGEATHGMLLTYVLCALEIEKRGVTLTSGYVLTAQTRAAMYLKLHELPPDKVRPSSSRFGGEW